jgi:ABC-2 type transport system permease protein
MKTTTHAQHRTPTAHVGAAPLAGLGTMIRFILRRDRIKLPAWIIGHGLFVIYITAALPQLAPTQRDLAGLTTLLTQPVGRMFTGPAIGLEDPTYERFFAAGYAPYLFIIAALMSIFLVTRHTRAEEQSGRAELLRASVLGRHTMLTATLIVAGLANLAAAAIVTALTLAAWYPTAGSILVGVATGMTGMVFAGITAVTVQINEFSRAAAGMAGAVLGAAFVLRAVGDMAEVGGSAISWVSPLAWAAQTAPYVENRWWPLALSAGLAVATIIIAFVLQDRRDFGASLMPPRPGNTRAHPMLGHPLGLAARLQRGGVLGWGFGILALGVIDGLFTQAMLDAADAMPPELAAVFGSDQLLEGYVGFLASFVAILTAAYVVYAMQTLRAEESTGRADAVLATPVSRPGWLGAHALVVALGALLILVITGLGTGLASAAVTGEAWLIGEVIEAHLATAPAVLVVLGITAGLFGILPRLMTLVGWLAVAVIAIVDLFGELLDLPEWFRALSPLWHLATIPAEDFEPIPFIVLLALAAVTVVIGLAGFRRREINIR